MTDKSLRRVLLVDDDIEYARVITESLVVASEHYYEITIANTYEEAVEMLRFRTFDFAIVDCFLGGAQSGLALLREIDRGNTGMPVLMLTAFAREPLVSHALELGAVAVVHKSRCDVTQLLQIVRIGSAAMRDRKKDKTSLGPAPA